MLIRNSLPLMIIPRMRKFIINFLDFLLEGDLLLDRVHVELGYLLEDCELVDYFLFYCAVEVAECVEHWLGRSGNGSR